MHLDRRPSSAGEGEYDVGRDDRGRCDEIGGPKMAVAELDSGDLPRIGSAPRRQSPPSADKRQGFHVIPASRETALAPRQANESPPASVSLTCRGTSEEYARNLASDLAGIGSFGQERAASQCPGGEDIGAAAWRTLAAPPARHNTQPHLTALAAQSAPDNSRANAPSAQVQAHSQQDERPQHHGENG